MINISLLLPTKNRISLVDRLFDSIFETAQDLNSLEVILYIDENDKESHQIFHANLNLKKIVGSHNTMGYYNNSCYKESSGKYVMLINDDIIFKTVNWDYIVINEFKKFDDEIALVYGNDKYQKKNVATFPILSRKACEIMGGVCPEEYESSYIDLHLHDIFNKMKKMGYNRLIYLPDIIFEHMHFEIGKSDSDRVYLDKDPRKDELLFLSTDTERHIEALKLIKHIRDFKTNK